MSKKVFIKLEDTAKPKDAEVILKNCEIFPCVSITETTSEKNGDNEIIVSCIVTFNNREFYACKCKSQT